MVRYVSFNLMIKLINQTLENPSSEYRDDQKKKDLFAETDKKYTKSSQHFCWTHSFINTM